MNQTHQKDVKHSKSFKAPESNGLTDHTSTGVYLLRKKPLPLKKLEKEYKDDTIRRTI